MQDLSLLCGLAMHVIIHAVVPCTIAVNCAGDVLPRETGYCASGCFANLSDDNDAHACYDRSS